MAERTWIHAFTDGRDVSPTSAVARPRRAPARADRHRLRPLLGDGPGQALGAHRPRASPRSLDGAGTAAPTRSPTCGELRRGRDRRVRRAGRLLAGARGSSPHDAAIFFNFRPDRARQLARAAARARRRPDDDDAVPRGLRRARSRSPSRRCATRSPRCSRGHGVRQLHAAETEKYAHVTYFFNGGDEREWRGRGARARPVAARRRELRPEAGDVGGGGGRARSRARSATAIAFGVVNFANPDMVGHTGSIPAVDPGGRDRGRLPRRGSSTRSHAAGGVCLVTADHGNAEADARRRRREPAHRPHDQSGAARGHGSGGQLREGGELSDLAPTALALLGIDIPAEMTGTVAGRLWRKAGAILRPHCHSRSLILASCGRRSGATSERSRSSFARTRCRSSTT